MNIRSLTPEGIDRVHLLLDDMRVGTTSAVPSELLGSADLSSDTGISIAKPPLLFESRYQLALWLNQQLDNTSMIEVTLSVGTWTWLTLLLLDVIAPMRSDGTRKIRDRSLYVLEPDNWRRYYRHLLAGPFRVMRAHWNEPHITQAILAGKPHVPGEIYEQIASRQELVTSRAVVALTRQLYWDTSRKGLKRGSGSKGAGGSRRLYSLLDQLDLTWDFGEVTDEALLALVPKKEYSRFMNEALMASAETS